MNIEKNKRKTFRENVESFVDQAIKELSISEEISNIVLQDVYSTRDIFLSPSNLLKKLTNICLTTTHRGWISAQ